MEIFVPLLFVGFVILGIVSVVERNAAIERGKVHIENLVKKHGGTRVFVQQDPAVGEQRSWFQYEVSFQDVAGVHRRTRCKIEREIGRVGAIYWRDDPFLPSYQAQLEATRSENAEMRSRLANRSATKEQIISGLARENERLKAELQALKVQTLEEAESK